MKKGFTLIELLAVIAILAILVIIAVPTVLKLFQDAQNNTFRTQAQTIFKAAEQQYMSDQISGEATADKTYCFGTSGTPSKLDLSGSDKIYYKVVFTSSKISAFTISDGKKSIEIASDPTIDGIQSQVLGTISTISCP